MPRLPIYLYLCLLIAFNCTGVAAQSKEAQAALDRLVSQVQTYRLENGLKLIVYKRGSAPVFSGALAVRVGGVDEAPGITGISHMFEHMAFKGTKGIGTKDYKKEEVLLNQLEQLMLKQSQGAALSEQEISQVEALNKELSQLWINSEFNQEYERRGAVGLNAQTGKELTTYYVEMPSSQLEFWCWIESERLLSPVMRQFYSERDVVMEERRMRYENDPQGALYELLLAKHFPGHPYRLPVIGFSADIAGLTASATDEFRRKYYVPSNMVFSIVGDVDPEKTFALFKKYFERIPAAPAPALAQAAELMQNAEQQVLLHKEVSPLLAVAYHKPNYPDPDAAPLSVLSEVLSGGRTSTLYKELVVEKQVATSVDTLDEPGELYPNALIFWMKPAGNISAASLLKLFDQSIAKFKDTLPSEQALEVVKRHFAAAYVQHLRSNHDLAQDFAENEALHSNWKASFDYYKLVMDVTSQQVQFVAKKYLVSKARTVAILQRAK